MVNNRVKIYGCIEKSNLVVSVSRRGNFKKSTVLFKKCGDIFKKFTVILFKKIRVLCAGSAHLYLRTEQLYARSAQ